MTYEKQIINNKFSLPLSWIYNFNLSKPKFHYEEDKTSWISLLECPNTIDFNNFIDEKIIRDKKLIIRGCSKIHKKILDNKCCESIITGQEAILETNKDYFEKKSLKELIRRGFRNGNVTELPYSVENRKLLNQFYQLTIHSDEPRLKNLFFDNFLDAMNLFVFSKNDDLNNIDNWFGAVLLSQNSKAKLHTELLLRRKNAPIGIMECLIFEIFHLYKNSSIKEISLGEVPFLTSSVKLSVKERFFIYVGKSLRFAYNYEGLFHFKNKFSPKWEDLYLCSYPKIKLYDLIKLGSESNFFSLIKYKILN